MKKLFMLLALILCVMGTYADEIDVVLDKNSATTEMGKPAPWTFDSNGVKVEVGTNSPSTINLSYGTNEKTASYTSYSANVDFTITVPVNFIPSKITFKGYTDYTSNHANLYFNDDLLNGKEFGNYNETETTCEYNWPEGKRSINFHVGPYESLAATITITGKLYPYYATMAKNGFCTFSADKNVMVSDGVTIWGVNNCNGNNNSYTITTTNLSNNGNKIINANKGVILQGTPNKTYLFDETSNFASMWPVDEKLLKAALTAKKVDNDYTFVLICNKNNDAQFARLKNGSTIPAGKAYMEIPNLATNSSYTLSLYFSDVTGIHEVKANKEADNNYYSLDGKKLSDRPDYGTYIHKGHVYMTK